MSKLCKNTFFLNNDLYISKKIQNIPFYFFYFQPTLFVEDFDCSMSPIQYSNQEIAYKLVEKEDFDYPLIQYKTYPSFTGISLYHVFSSCQLLHKNNTSFILFDDSIIFFEKEEQRENRLPVLQNFGYSLYFPHVSFDLLISYFPIDFLENKYICLDVFLICYLVQYDINIFDLVELDKVTSLFLKQRNYYDKNYVIFYLQYFLNFSQVQIIKYLFQFKYTWTFVSLCDYFLLNYKDLCNSLQLTELFKKYMNSLPKERNKEFINNIYECIFV
tara:strand:- start:3336 stop:4154 length:819 start_codon:yes stop_codon:yes gene_type:complete